jgi:RNA polymerase sigma factor (sigma-70 family)
LEPEVNGVEDIAVSREESLDPIDGSLGSWSDTHLVRACLGGNEAAWAELIHRYKRLIYSIPIKYGASPDDAADIFQAVCLELFSELSNLRKTESVKSWLITVAAHQSFHWKKRQRVGNVELDGMEPELAEAQVPATGALPPEIMEEVQREQMMREAFAKLQPRCAQMMRLLFYEDPPLAYVEVAQRLGLATGSIGFIRGRCLKKLEKILTEMGF